MTGISLSSRLGRSWYVVAMLIILYAFSFVDRYIIALLAAPLSRDLGISDVDLGILLGAGFAVVYSVAGLPIANWIDRGPRVRIVVAGAVVWSLMTVLSAFAHSYLLFALCRMGLAVGEAALTPAAISLIADLFPPEKRAFPTALYVSLGSVMVTGALIVGAIALDVAHMLQPLVGMATWRIALVLCGLPGIFFGLLILLTVSEPPRASPQPGARGGSSAGTKALLAYLKANRRFYIPFFAADAFAMMYVMALAAWMPTVVIRGFGLSASHVGYMLGMVGVPMTVVGTFFWPAIIGWLRRKGRPDGIFICLVAGLGLIVPLVVASPLIPMLTLSLAVFGIMKVALANTSIMPPLAIQSFAPGVLRGRLIAIHLLMINLVGFAIGPVLVPRIAVIWAGDDMALGRALSVVAGVTMALAVALFFLARLAFNPAALQRLPSTDEGEASPAPETRTWSGT